ncbi:unnamed protein product [Didymodactylos carnosus]|uniref:Chitobiosyldiphosphodolichol beta-mannosyltransferase n=1 Tax=Didymodactylos carnosus TaxID=1234261 RepID=A0A813RIA4_9BILA|nr:unnamed protein product [Didymodactylos carnosus]CAF0830847.1 unnamed protein product [Didymodactylos carnosus]CAF3568048.1 unnamed protein product [Didymodactylos carnosus]CAF3615399.1 unnamed protein product [Didymodactylos carnosus]
MFTFILAIVVVFGIILISKLRRRAISDRSCVYVVVLGDIGHSPRMCNHAIEFEKNQYSVHFIGYEESQPSLLIQENRNIHLANLKSFPSLQFAHFPPTVVYVLKIFWQFGTLGLKLCQLPKPDIICVQNPPSIPALITCFLVARLRGVRFYIDWHNYGYSMLALKHGMQHWIVQICQRYEFFMGRLADINTCVSQAFSSNLKLHLIKSSVLYDRPTSQFHIPSTDEKHAILMKMYQQYGFKQFEGRMNDCTRFTTSDKSFIKDRPAILVSSTSWSPDENFQVLFDALKQYDTSDINNLPSIVCIITGKGPLKDEFVEKLQQQSHRRVEYCFPWLDAADYPLLLGCADLGISLHQSSSGFDLPMKIVDMLAVGVPVCSIHYDCINELVKRDQNGLIFRDSNDLCERIQDLLSGFPDNCSKLNSLKANVISGGKVSNWTKEWSTVVKPLLSVTTSQQNENNLSSQ